jgi:hypothetical protein
MRLNLLTSSASPTNVGPQRERFPSVKHTSSLFYKNMAIIVSDACTINVSKCVKALARVVNYTPRVINYAPNGTAHF